VAFCLIGAQTASALPFLTVFLLSPLSLRARVMAVPPSNALPVLSAAADVKSVGPSARAPNTAPMPMSSSPVALSAPLSYLIIGARSQDVPSAATQAALLQHFLSDGVQAHGRLLVGDTLSSAGVMGEVNRLFGSPAPGQGIVVCYSGHCSATGALALQGKGGAAESVTPAQLLKAWSGSAAFKAGGSLFLLLNCCHSGIWAVATRAREAERVWVQCSSPADLTTFDGPFPALWIEFAVGRLTAAALRSRLPASPAAYAPDREGCAVLIGADELKGTPLAALMAERSGTQCLQLTQRVRALADSDCDSPLIAQDT
jgi:hypothetical protein